MKGYIVFYCGFLNGMVLIRCSFLYEKVKMNLKYIYNIWLFLKVKKKYFIRDCYFRLIMILIVFLIDLI